MKNRKRLDECHQKFLRQIRDGVLLLPQLMKQLGMNPQRLARWFRRDFFREALGGIRQELRRMKWLELELLANAAVKTLQEMLLKPSKRSLLLLLICLAILVEFDRAWKRHYRGGKRGRRKKVPEPTNLCHPDSKDRDDFLLKQLMALD